MIKKDNMYYMWRLSDRFYDLVEGKDAYYDQEFFEDNSVEEMIRNIAIHWDEARVLVEVLEDSHLDDEYSPEKCYEIEHLADGSTRGMAIKLGKDSNIILRSSKTRAEILKRLPEIANDDFGDDPDEWRAWYQAFDDDPYFPPYR